MQFPGSVQSPQCLASDRLRAVVQGGSGGQALQDLWRHQGIVRASQHHGVASPPSGDPCSHSTWSGRLPTRRCLGRLPRPISRRARFRPQAHGVRRPSPESINATVMGSSYQPGLAAWLDWYGPWTTAKLPEGVGAGTVAGEGPVLSPLPPITSRAHWLGAGADGGPSRAAAGTVLSAVSGPRSADQAADGDDGVGEVEEGINDGGSAFVAASDAVKAVLPGVGPFDVPPLACLDGRLLALVRDAAVQAERGEFGAGLVRVVADVQVRGDVVGQRSRRSRVGASSGESWRFAPASRRPSGVP